jgi:hypothetical protein
VRELVGGLIVRSVSDVTNELKRRFHTTGTVGQVGAVPFSGAILLDRSESHFLVKKINNALWLVAGQSSIDRLATG